MSAVMNQGYGPLPAAMILRPDFASCGTERHRIAAGAAAFQRAILLGYCRTAASALRRVAKREWFPGETPETTAHRIVRLPADAVMVRPPQPPKSAA